MIQKIQGCPRVGIKVSCAAWLAVMAMLSLVLLVSQRAWAGEAAGQAQAQARVPLQAGAASSAGHDTAATTDNAVVQQAEAPVTVFNRQVLVFRVPYLGMSPQERARRSMRNIDQALDQGGPGSVSVKSTPQGELIFIDGLMTLILSDADVDPMGGGTLQELSARTVKALQQSIKATQESRDTDHLLKGIAMVLAATATAGLLLYGLSLARARVLAALQRFVERKTAALGAGAADILRRERIAAVLGVLELSLSWALALLCAYAWLSFSLQCFAYTRPWGDGLHDFLISVAKGLFLGIVGAVPGLVVAVLILLLARGAAGVLGSFFERVEKGQLGVQWMTPDSAGPTRRIATWLIWLFALAMAYPYLPGAQTEAFKGMSVLIGLMMSMGASSFVGQVAGGMILTYSNMLRKGEYVRIAEHEGTGLLPRVPAGVPGHPERTAPARRGAGRLACQHPGRVQRVRRADHVAALHAGSPGCQGGAAFTLVHRAGAHATHASGPGAFEHRLRRGSARFHAALLAVACAFSPFSPRSPRSIFMAGLAAMSAAMAWASIPISRNMPVGEM